MSGQTAIDPATRFLDRIGARRWTVSEAWVLVGLFGFVLCLSLAPLGRLLSEALMPGGNFELTRLVRLYGEGLVWRATINTLQIAAGATVIAVILGAAMASVIAVTDVRGKAAIVFCFILPLMIPPQVSALAWLQALGPSSTLLGMVDLAPPPGSPHPLFSMWGIIALLGMHNAPLVFLATRASMRAVPADLVDAARSNGAGPFTTMHTVILPLASAGLISGGAIAFVSAAGNFGIQAMLGIPARIPTLITLIFQRLSDYGPSVLADAAALALGLAVIAICGLGLQSWLIRRRDLRVTGTGAQFLEFRLGRWRTPTAVVCWVGIAVVLFIPLGALLTAALVRAYGLPLSWETLTFRHFANALFNHTAIRRAFLTSLSLASMTAVILMLVAIPLGYFLTWRKSLAIRLLSLSAELSYALPGAVIAIAAILFFLKPLPFIGVSLYGTIWIILAAYLANRLLLALRPTVSGFLQIDRALDEAARVAGAGFVRSLKDVLLPMVAPCAAAGAILVFLTALAEIQ
ncbi:MAG: iron ABC transporter permease [Rhodospirillales bacterium]|nr:iron ABC transporter permease [Rhodospirillales bacterium]